jgi:hypothetical protein
MSRILDVETSKFTTRKRAAEHAVMRWEWATGPYYELSPYFAECCGTSRGRLLPGAPTSKRDKYAFGFDAMDRLRVIRQHVDKQRAYETFIEWTATRAVCVRYGYDPTYNAAETVDVLTLRRGRPIKETHYSHNPRVARGSRGVDRCRVA